MGCCANNGENNDNQSFINQKLLSDHPLVSKEIHEKINRQLYINLCKINFPKESSQGSGFFCRIPYPDEFHLLPTLITNNHVISEDYLSTENEIEISINDISKKINDLKKRKTYTNKDYDITIIEIFPDKDNILHFWKLMNLFLKLKMKHNLLKRIFIFCNIQIIYAQYHMVSYQILMNLILSINVQQLMVLQEPLFYL